MGNALDGFAIARKWGQEDRAENRSIEVQQAELKSQQLAQQLEQARFEEHRAQQGLRQRLLEAQVKTAETKDPLALAQAKMDLAKYQAEAAKWRAEAERLDYETKRQLHDLTNLINSMKQQMGGQQPGGAPSFLPTEDEGIGSDPGTESTYIEDTRDIPAGGYPFLQGAPGGIGQPSSDLGATTKPVPGGRRVLTGPPKAGNQMELEQTIPITPKGSVARSILPPMEPTPGEERTIPIMSSEVEHALKSKNVNDSIKKLLSTEGPAFGQEMVDMKRDNPGKYMEQIGKVVDEHEKAHPEVYRAFQAPGTRESRLREYVMRILNDPEERAAVNPIRDVDAAVSEAVAELSMENLIDQKSKWGLRSYLTIDAANGGDIARYNGRRLNQALDETFGDGGAYVRFSEDLDYTLRQIIQALYTDEMSASGNALLGYTEPIRLGYKRSSEHKALEFLDAYWRPLRDLEKQVRRTDRQDRMPTFGRRHF